GGLIVCPLTLVQATLTNQIIGKEIRGERQDENCHHRSSGQDGSGDRRGPARPSGFAGSAPALRAAAARSTSARYRPALSRGHGTAVAAIAGCGAKDC